jgi:hypothetical protein
MMNSNLSKENATGNEAERRAVIVAENEAIFKAAAACYEEILREYPDAPPDLTWYHVRTASKAHVLWKKFNGWEFDIDEPVPMGPPDADHGPVRLLVQAFYLSSRERMMTPPNPHSIWGIQGEYWDGERWQYVDSAADCIDWVKYTDPFKNPHAATVMLATIAAYNAFSKHRPNAAGQ